MEKNEITKYLQVLNGMQTFGVNENIITNNNAIRKTRIFHQANVTNGRQRQQQVLIVKTLIQLLKATMKIDVVLHNH